MKYLCLIVVIALFTSPLCRGQYVYVLPFSGPARNVADVVAAHFGVDKLFPVAVFGETQLTLPYRYERYKVMIIAYSPTIPPVGYRLCYGDVEWPDPGGATIVLPPTSTFYGCPPFLPT